MNLLRQTISKLYYGKWPFKIKMVVSGSWMIKRRGIEPTLKYCEGTEKYNLYHREINKPRLLAFTNTIQKYLTDDVNVRVEGSIFSLYCKDPVIFEAISKACSEYIVAEYAPASATELDFMNSNSAKKVLCNHIPFNQYPYKVHVKYNTPINTRLAFSKWLQNYNGKIKLASATYNWLKGVNSYNTLIVYVEDQPTLSMVGMFLGSHIAKVEEFIPRSSINTSLKQEETCQL